jgi:predicted TPR repeat methyltransferase
MLAAGDVNADGTLDLVGGQNPVYVHFGIGDGTVGRRRIGDDEEDLITASMTGVLYQRGVGDGTFAAPQSHYIGAHATAFALGDLNQDGRLDILVSTDRLLALFGTGDGSFACMQDYLSEPGAFQLSLGDMNSDGKIDALAFHGH